MFRRKGNPSELIVSRNLAKTFWIVITQVLRGGNDWKYKVELVSTISVAAIDSVARYDTRAPDKEQ